MTFIPRILASASNTSTTTTTRTTTTTTTTTTCRAGFNWWEAWGPVYLGGTGWETATTL